MTHEYLRLAAHQLAVSREPLRDRVRGVCPTLRLGLNEADFADELHSMVRELNALLPRSQARLGPGLSRTENRRLIHLVVELLARS